MCYSPIWLYLSLCISKTSVQALLWCSVLQSPCVHLLFPVALSPTLPRLLAYVSLCWASCLGCVWDDICTMSLCHAMGKENWGTNAEGRERRGNGAWICSEWSWGWRRGHTQARQKFKSICTQSSLNIRTPQVWWSLWLWLSACLLTILSCSCSPGPDGRKTFFFILQPQYTVRESARFCREEYSLVCALAFVHAKLLLFLHLVNGAVGTFQCF